MMDYEILNCYELELRQDIPADMEGLKNTNRKLESKNKIFIYLIAAIGFGVILYSIYHSSKSRKKLKNEK
jgi:hypothetical protein